MIIGIGSLLRQVNFKILLWYGINIPLIFAIVTHQSTNRLILDRYGYYYFPALVLCLLLIPGVLLIHSRRFRRYVIAAIDSRFTIPLLLILGAAAVFLWIPIGEARIPRAFVAFNTLYAVFLLQTAKRDDAPSPPAVRGWDALLLVIFVGMLVLAFFSAYREPAEHVFGDEIGWTDYAMAWRDTGMIYYHMVGAPPIPITLGAGWWVTIYARWIDVFGQSLATARLFVYTMYALASVLTAWAGARLYTRRIGLLAGIVFAGSAFVIAHRWLRPELLMAIPVALILVLIAAKQRRALAAFGIGLTAAASIDIHGSGIVLIGVTTLLFAAELLGDLVARRRPNWLMLVGFALGGIVGAAWFVLTHILILPDPSAFFTALRGSRGFLETGATDSLSILNAYWTRFSAFSLHETILLAATMLGLALRREKPDRLILAFLLAGLVGFFALVPGGERYVVGWMPVIAVGLAALIERGFIPFQGITVTRRRAAVATAGALVFIGFAVMLALPAVSLTQPYPPPTISARSAWLRDVINDPSAVVVGDIASYWAMTDYPNFYMNFAEYEVRYHVQQEPPYGIWTSIDPDVVIFKSSGLLFEPGPYLRNYLRDFDFQPTEYVDPTDQKTTTLWTRPSFSLNEVSLED